MERKYFTINYSGNNGGLSNGDTESKSGNSELVFSSTYVNDKNVKLKAFNTMNTQKNEENEAQPIIEVKKKKTQSGY